MGLISKLFGLMITCPECGRHGAKDSLAGVRCQNEHCHNYDPVYAREQGGGRDDNGEHLPREAFSTMKVPASAKIDENDEVVTFDNPGQIEYENFRGQIRMFTIDAGSIEDKGNCIWVKVAPSGKRITLQKDRIREQSFGDTEEIIYENFRGEVRTFIADTSSIVDKGNCITVKVAPSGERITLQKDKIRERRKA